MNPLSQTNKNKHFLEFSDDDFSRLRWPKSDIPNDRVVHQHRPTLTSAYRSGRREAFRAALTETATETTTTTTSTPTVSPSSFQHTRKISSDTTLENDDADTTLPELSKNVFHIYPEMITEETDKIILADEKNKIQRKKS